MRILWSNTRERTQENEKRPNEDSSYPKGIELLLRETAKAFPDPEEIDDPMVAPQECHVCQSGRVLKLRNKDLWIRPTDMSWNFPILITIREMAFKSYRGRSVEKLKAREKLDETKKQKTLKN